MEMIELADLNEFEQRELVYLITGVRAYDEPSKDVLSWIDNGSLYCLLKSFGDYVGREVDDLDRLVLTLLLVQEYRSRACWVSDREKILSAFQRHVPDPYGRVDPRGRKDLYDIPGSLELYQAELLLPIHEELAGILGATYDHGVVNAILLENWELLLGTYGEPAYLSKLRVFWNASYLVGVERYGGWRFDDLVAIGADPVYACC